MPWPRLRGHEAGLGYRGHSSVPDAGRLRTVLLIMTMGVFSVAIEKLPRDVLRVKFVRGGCDRPGFSHHTGAPARCQGRPAWQDRTESLAIAAAGDMLTVGCRFHETQEE